MYGDVLPSNLSGSLSVLTTNATCMRWETRPIVFADVRYLRRAYPLLGFGLVLDTVPSISLIVQ